MKNEGIEEEEKRITDLLETERDAIRRRDE